MSIVLAATQADRRRAARLAREAIAAVTKDADANAAKVLQALEESRARLVAMLQGTEFDQAFARRMLMETDREINRLRAMIQPTLAQSLAQTMRSADAFIVSEAARQLGQAMNTPALSMELIDLAQRDSIVLVQQITEDARKQIANALRRGATGSMGPSDVARSIGGTLERAQREPSVFGDLAQQVEKVHRTETGRLYEHAAEVRRNRIAKEDTGLRVTKTWVHVLRGRRYARPDHEYLHLVTIPHDEHFNVGAGPTWSRVSYEEAQRQGGTLGFRASGPLDGALPAKQAVRCGCTVATGFEKETT